jgi:hypothetical protein
LVGAVDKGQRPLVRKYIIEWNNKTLYEEMIIPVNAFEKGAHFSFGSSRLLFRRSKGVYPLLIIII